MKTVTLQKLFYFCFVPFDIMLHRRFHYNSFGKEMLSQNLSPLALMQTLTWIFPLTSGETESKGALFVEVCLQQKVKHFKLLMLLDSFVDDIVF